MGIKDQNSINQNSNNGDEFLILRVAYVDSSFVPYAYTSTRVNNHQQRIHRGLRIRNRGIKYYLRNKQRAIDWIRKTFNKNGAWILSPFKFDQTFVRIVKNLNIPEPVPVYRLRARICVLDEDLFSQLISSGIGALKCCGYGKINVKFTGETKKFYPKKIRSRLDFGYRVHDTHRSGK